MYVDKINSLLDDTSTYEISNLTMTLFHSTNSSKNLSETKNTWTSFIEHHPRILIYGQNPLPKHPYMIHYFHY